MLAFESDVPEGFGADSTVAVLLHGRGSNRHDLFGLRPRLPADWAVIAPDAPHDAAPWGYGPGRAWYRYLGRNRPEPESFTASLQALEELVAAISGAPGVPGAPAIPGVPAGWQGRLVLGGFSQGGTMSLGYALTHPGQVDAVLNFSGFLADHPRVAATSATVNGSRIFWGHGVSDTSIPFALAIEGRELLRRAGANLTAKDYQIGHWIDPRELADAVEFVG